MKQWLFFQEQLKKSPCKYKIDSDFNFVFFMKRGFIPSCKKRDCSYCHHRKMKKRKELIANLELPSNVYTTCIVLPYYRLSKIKRKKINTGITNWFSKNLEHYAYVRSTENNKDWFHRNYLLFSLKPVDACKLKHFLTKLLNKQLREKISFFDGIVEPCKEPKNYFSYIVKFQDEDGDCVVPSKEVEQQPDRQSNNWNKFWLYVSNLSSPFVSIANEVCGSDPTGQSPNGKVLKMELQDVESIDHVESSKKSETGIINDNKVAGVVCWFICWLKIMLASPIYTIRQFFNSS